MSSLYKIGSVITHRSNPVHYLHDQLKMLENTYGIYFCFGVIKASGKNDLEFFLYTDKGTWEAAYPIGYKLKVRIPELKKMK